MPDEHRAVSERAAEKRIDATSACFARHAPQRDERAADARGSAPERLRQTVNNELPMLKRMLVIALERGLITHVPEIEWLKLVEPEVVFLSFEESERLLEAVEEKHRCMASRH